MGGNLICRVRYIVVNFLGATKQDKLSDTRRSKPIHQYLYTQGPIIVKNISEPFAFDQRTFTLRYDIKSED